MHTLALKVLMLLGVLRSASAATITTTTSIDNNFGPAVSPVYSGDLCLGFPEVTYICQQCLDAGLTFSMASCCHDSTAIDTCNECLLSPDPCIQQSADGNLEALLTNSDYTTDEIDTPNTDPVKRALKENIQLQRFLAENSDTHPSLFLRDSSIHTDRVVTKRWYNPYKYILGLFPQRLSYGHSVFLQSMMAQRSKSRNKGKVHIAWMKRSERDNNDIRKGFLDLFKNLPRESESVNEPTKSSSYPLVSYNVADNSVKRRVFAEDSLLQTEVNSQDMADSDSLIREDPVPEMSWSELYNKTPHHAVITGMTGTRESKRFIGRLLLFIDVLKQAALDYFTSSGTHDG